VTLHNNGTARHARLFEKSHCLDSLHQGGGEANAGKREKKIFADPGVTAVQQKPKKEEGGRGLNKAGVELTLPGSLDWLHRKVGASASARENEK